MPNIGFWAVAGAGGGAAGAYELISTTVLSTATASVTFNSIPANTYKHLQIRATAKASNAATGNLMSLRIDGATTGYNSHHLEANGASVTSGSWGSESYIPVSRIPAAGDTSGAFTAAVIEILDSFSTSKNKTVRTLSGYAGSINWLSLRSGLYLSTSATSSVTLLPYDSANFIAGSRFSLYGIKG